MPNNNTANALFFSKNSYNWKFLNISQKLEVYSLMQLFKQHVHAVVVLANFKEFGNLSVTNRFLELNAYFICQKNYCCLITVVDVN